MGVVTVTTYRLWLLFWAVAATTYQLLERMGLRVQVQTKTVQMDSLDLIDPWTQVDPPLHLRLEVFLN